MPEHDEDDALEPVDEVEDEVEEQQTSTTPNLHIPKAKRWRVENK